MTPSAHAGRQPLTLAATGSPGDAVPTDRPPFASKNGKRWTFTATLRPRDLQPESVDLQLREAMRRIIGRQCLSLSPLWNIEGLPIAVALPLLRTFNDALARIVASSDQMSWAAVPSADVQAACAELLRAASMGLKVWSCPLPAGILRAGKTFRIHCSRCARRRTSACSSIWPDCLHHRCASEEPCPWHMRIGWSHSTRLARRCWLHVRGACLRSIQAWSCSSPTWEAAFPPAWNASSGWLKMAPKHVGPSQTLQCGHL